LSAAKSGVGVQADQSVPDFAPLNPGYSLQARKLADRLLDAAAVLAESF